MLLEATTGSHHVLSAPHLDTPVQLHQHILQLELNLPATCYTREPLYADLSYAFCRPQSRARTQRLTPALFTSES